MKKTASPTRKTTRHGKRAKDMTVITFSVNEELKEYCAALARKDQRSLSSWLRIHLQEITRHLKTTKDKNSAK